MKSTQSASDDFVASETPQPEDAIDLPAEQLRAILAWDWQSEEGRQLALQLCEAVSNAEQIESPGSPIDDSEEARLAQGQWLRACQLAAQLREHVPGPYPAIVSDCLDRIDAAADVRGVVSEPGGSEPSM